MSEAPSNTDMLAWFSDDERGICETCREKARGTVPDARVSLCLACGAITLDGKRIDVNRRIPT